MKRLILLMNILIFSILCVMAQGRIEPPLDSYSIGLISWKDNEPFKEINIPYIVDGNVEEVYVHGICSINIYGLWFEGNEVKGKVDRFSSIDTDVYKTKTPLSTKEQYVSMFWSHYDQEYTSYFSMPDGFSGNLYEYIIPAKNGRVIINCSIKLPDESQIDNISISWEQQFD